MGLFNLFGGKKKDEAKVRPASAKAARTGQPAGNAVEPLVAHLAAGSAQVKLRLKLVHSLRTGETAAAYAAAKSLADIQAKAGRRTGARVWQKEAERIKARDPDQAAA